MKKQSTGILSRKQSTGILFFFLLAAACAGGRINAGNAVPGNQPEPAGTPPAAEQKTKSGAKKDGAKSDLASRIEQIAADAKGRVGVFAALLETGETVSLNPKERFPMQSFYKLPIAMAVLSRVDAGKIKLDQTVRLEKDDFVKNSRSLPAEKYPNGGDFSVRQLLRMMVSESDNTASDAMLKFVGGPEAVMSYLESLGIKEIVVADPERELGRDRQAQYRNWASPEAAVALLRALHERRALSEQTRSVALQFMTESPTGPKRLKGQLPAGTVVAHKTGTSATEGGITAATNDVGIVTLPGGRHLAIAVFVSDSPADEATREGVIAKIARAVWDEWNKK